VKLIRQRRWLWESISPTGRTAKRQIYFDDGVCRIEGGVVTNHEDKLGYDITRRNKWTTLTAATKYKRQPAGISLVAEPRMPQEGHSLSAFGTRPLLKGGISREWPCNLQQDFRLELMSCLGFLLGGRQSF
jgi:hypothetical protein